MNTVINNPGNNPGTVGEGESTGTGLVLGVILAIVIIVLFLIYGLPAIRGTSTPRNDTINVDVNLPPNDVTPPPATP